MIEERPLSQIEQQIADAWDNSHDLHKALPNEVFELAEMLYAIHYHSYHKDQNGNRHYYKTGLTDLWARAFERGFACGMAYQKSKQEHQK